MYTDIPQQYYSFRGANNPQAELYLNGTIPYLGQFHLTFFGRPSVAEKYGQMPQNDPFMEVMELNGFQKVWSLSGFGPPQEAGHGKFLFRKPPDWISARHQR